MQHKLSNKKMQRKLLTHTQEAKCNQLKKFP